MKKMTLVSLLFGGVFISYRLRFEKGKATDGSGNVFRSCGQVLQQLLKK